MPFGNTIRSCLGEFVGSVYQTQAIKSLNMVLIALV
jgi:hypothetical protein